MGVLIGFACYLGFFLAVASAAPNSFLISRFFDKNQYNKTCTTDDNRSGKWDFISNCDQITFLRKIGREIEILKVLGYHNDEMVICCVSRTELVSISLTNTISGRAGGVQESPRAPPYCLGVEDHIVKGKRAKVGEYTHMAALGYYDGTENKLAFNCGGTLISDRFVLTAAHCTAKRIDTPAFVRLGRTSLNLTDPNDPGKVLEIFVKNAFLPNEYDALTLTNDIALLELENKIVFDADMCSNVKPAKLWEHVFTGDEPSNLIVIGFGRTGFNKPRSDWLLESTLREMPLNECRAKLGFQATLTEDSHLCCHDPVGNQDACQGDSGSSLQIREHDGYKIVGVVSFGVGCGNKGIPSVYTRVSTFIPWINRIVWPTEEEIRNKL